MPSTPDAHSAYEFYLECQKLMAAGGMNLRKWHSNSPELLERIKFLSSWSQDHPHKVMPVISQPIQGFDLDTC